MIKNINETYGDLIFGEGFGNRHSIDNIEHEDEYQRGYSEGLKQGYKNGYDIGFEEGKEYGEESGREWQRAMHNDNGID